MWGFRTYRNKYEQRIDGEALVTGHHLTHSVLTHTNVHTHTHTSLKTKTHTPTSHLHIPEQRVRYEQRVDGEALVTCHHLTHSVHRAVRVVSQHVCV